MARPEREHEATTIKTHPPIRIRPFKPATAEEIARRRALFEEAMELRERIGPIGVTTADLIREDRDEVEDQEHRG